MDDITADSLSGLPLFRLRPNHSRYTLDGYNPSLGLRAFLGRTVDYRKIKDAKCIRRVGTICRPIRLELDVLRRVLIVPRSVIPTAPFVGIAFVEFNLLR